MEDIDRQPTPANPPPLPSPPDALLAEQLARCHSAVAGCFEFCRDETVLVSQQLETLNVATRLIRASVALAAALDKLPREFTHRVVVEHIDSASPPPMIDVTPERAGEPPPPPQKSKTTSA